MKQVISTVILFLVVVFFLVSTATAQSSDNTTHTNAALKTYLIERDIQGAGQLSPADLKGISQKSCSVLKEMGHGIVWLQSYVTGNKIFCVYQADNESMLKEHAKKGGFPVTSITEINNTISPKTAD